MYDVRRATFIELEHVRRLLDAIYGPDNAKAVDVALAWLFRAARQEWEMRDKRRVRGFVEGLEGVRVH